MLSRILSCAVFLFCVRNADDAVPSTDDIPADVATDCSGGDKPNILFILLDDLGWGDISATTGAFPTPNMDSLYNDALQLTRHYVHLMCSPSRTQFLTGRYAMNLGFGVFQPWDDSEIGGIPIGQPTIANWLHDFGDYTTYGVGKWHLGYANRQLTPLYNGFDHFYGFYQGAIDYATKTYNDIEAGDIGVYDFWEDGEPIYEMIGNEDNTMELYGAKIVDILETEGAKRYNGQHESVKPFYLLATLQSMHVPFPDIAEYAEECAAMVEASMGSEQFKNGRKKYCALLLLTDKIVGDIMSALRTSRLWADTLVVFTTDNGGETARGASNMPFRGTKGELYEGNTRVLTSVTGGVIEKRGLFGKTRNELFSNLDWTPTLLDFAGYLDCIAPEDYTWEGVNQYPLLVNYEAAKSSGLARQHLVLNIGDAELNSASMLLEHEGSLYKFIRSSSKSATDRWIYSDNLADVWSVYDEDGHSLKIMTYAEDNEATQFSQVHEDGFLFDLTRDEAELINLLNPSSPGFDAATNAQINKKCTAILEQFMAEDELFSNQISALHARMDAGEPSLIGDGLFVRPFLSDDEYAATLQRIFKNEGQRGHEHPGKQMRLYLSPWVCPGTGTYQGGEGKRNGGDRESALSGDAGPLGMLGGFPGAMKEDVPAHNGSYSLSLSWWAKFISILAASLIMIVVVVTGSMFYCDKRRHKDYQLISDGPGQDAETE